MLATSLTGTMIQQRGICDAGARNDDQQIAFRNLGSGHLWSSVTIDKRQIVEPQLSNRMSALR